jgi:hypothetical protein
MAVDLAGKVLAGEPLPVTPTPESPLSTGEEGSSPPSSPTAPSPGNTAQVAAEMLLREALTRNSTDNLSILVVDLCP